MGRSLADEVVDVGEFPFELTSEEYANACRRAYLRIVVGAHVGWSKVELARWLTGPYRRLTHPTWIEGSESAIGLKASGAPDSLELSRRPDPRVDPDLTPIPPSGVSISDTRVQKLMDDMRTDALLVFRELMTAEGRSAFTSLAKDTQLVIRVQDESGVDVAVPCARPRMNLVERVLSLIAVDAMTRPEDFEYSLFVCERCDQPVFDIRARATGMCSVHVSGVNRTF